MTTRQSPLLLAGVLLATLLLLIVWSATTGAVDAQPGAVVRAAFDLVGLSVGPPDDSWVVVQSIRFPRIVLATLVGAVLAVSGATLQGIFRNPLADPGLIGVTSGAALATALALVLGARFFERSAADAPWLLAGAGFTGGLLVSLGLLATVRRHGRSVTGMLLLGGVALNAFAGAGTGALTMLATDSQLRSLTFWTLGGLGGATWATVAIAAVPIVLSLGAQLRHAAVLDLLLLGEREAAHLGVDVTKATRRAVLWAALGVGTSVAFAGGIGFVGLVVPHLVRLTLGASHRLVLPISLLGGSVLLLAADTISRSVFAPLEIPVGVMTALFGAPLLLVLISRQLGAVAGDLA